MTRELEYADLGERVDEVMKHREWDSFHYRTPGAVPTADRVYVDPKGETLVVVFRPNVGIWKQYLGRGITVAFNDSSGKGALPCIGLYDHDALVLHVAREGKWLGTPCWEHENRYTMKTVPGWLADWLRWNDPSI